MRRWSSKVGFFLALALVWAGAEFPSPAQSVKARGGTPLQFSGRPDATNSFGEAPGRRENLEALEDGLFGLNRTVAPKDSMQGVPPNISLRRRPPSKEMQDLMERRRNWMFASPESLPGGPNTSDRASLDELQKTGKLTAVEEYYLGLARQQETATALNEQNSGDIRERENETPQLPPGLRQREEELKRLLTTGLDNGAERDFDPFASTAQGSLARSDSGSTATPLPLPKYEVKRETPVDQYRQLLGLPTTALTVEDMFKAPNLVPERESSSRAPAPQTAPAPVILPALSGGPAGPGVGKAPTVAEVPRPLAPTSPVTAPAATETPRRMPPPTPTFTAPRRMF